MISVNRIKYNNYSSTDFDLLCDLAFDSDNGESDSFLTREAVASESYRGLFKRVHNYKYTETFSPQFTFIKKGFGDFTIEEQRKVLKWLTSTPNASFLTVYSDDSEVISWEALGGFTEITPYKLANGRTVGIVATFEATTPYALSPLKTVTKDMLNPNDNTITLNINTDEPQSFIYPRITIQQKGVKWYGIVTLRLEDDEGATYTKTKETLWEYSSEEEARIAVEALKEELIKDLSTQIYHELGYSDERIPYLLQVLLNDYNRGGNVYMYKPYTGEYDKDIVCYHDTGGYSFNEIPNETIFDVYKEYGIYTRFQVTFYDEVSILNNVFGNSNIDTTSVVITNTYLDINKTKQISKITTKNNVENEIIILDGANKIISSDRKTNRIFGTDFSWDWLPFVEGENIISITGICTITIEWREPIKCGA